MSTPNGLDGELGLPQIFHPTQQNHVIACRKKRRLKKREYKSASLVAPSRTSGPSSDGRSINSASSVFPSSTPVEDTSSSPSSITNSTRSFRQPELVRDVELQTACSNASLGFDAKYSPDYEQKKQRLLKGKFRSLLTNYFPDLIHSKKLLPDNSEEKEDDYDTDLDIDLGLELLADERAKRSKEDGLCAEYKQLCRKYRVVPNSYFMRHVMDDYMMIKYRYFSYGDSAALSNEIQNQPSVTSLDLEDNAMGPAGMLCFAEMLKSNAYITEANFANNNVGVFGARLMKFILVKNVRLVKLNMSGNKFGERGARYCAIAINVNSTLKELYLAHNGIGDEGANLIWKALGNNVGLEVLDLSWNQIGQRGAVGLAKALKANTRLRTLNMRMNGCHEEGCRLLVAALRFNDSLRELDLAANRIGEVGARAVCKALPFLKLETLKLAYNPLTSDVAENILKVLLNLEDHQLTHLDVEGVVVGDDFQLLAEELGHRGVTIDYYIPPSSRERSRDLPMATLNHVISFLDDVEMEAESLFPNTGDVDCIMTVQDLFTHMENSGMFMDKTRLLRLKQESQRDFRRRFLIKELFLVNTRRRQSMAEAMNTAHAVDSLDLTSGSLDPLGTERSSFSGDTAST